MDEFSRYPSFQNIEGTYTYSKFETAVASAVVRAMFFKRIPHIFEEAFGEEFRNLSRALNYCCIALWFADAVKRKLPECEHWVVQGNLLRAFEGGRVWDTSVMLTAQRIIGTKLDVQAVYAELESSPEYDVFERTAIKFMESLFIGEFMKPTPPNKRDLFLEHHEIIHSRFSQLEDFTRHFQSLALDVCNMVKKSITDNAATYRTFYTKTMVTNIPHSRWPH